MLWFLYTVITGFTTLGTASFLRAFKYRKLMDGAHLVAGEVIVVVLLIVWSFASWYYLKWEGEHLWPLWVCCIASGLFKFLLGGVEQYTHECKNQERNNRENNLRAALRDQIGWRQELQWGVLRGRQVLVDQDFVDELFAEVKVVSDLTGLNLNPSKVGFRQPDQTNVVDMLAHMRSVRVAQKRADENEKVDEAKDP